MAGLKEFVNRDGHIVVPDTSALVRGIWFEDFDWPTELGLTPVRIVIPILVIEELDLLKDRERTTKAGDRARRVVRRLRDLCGAVPPGHPANLPTRTNITVEVLLDDDRHTRRPNHDGEIIEQARLVKALTGQNVRFICVDAAMEFRARQHGLTVLAMPTRREPLVIYGEALQPSRYSSIRMQSGRYLMTHAYPGSAEPSPRYEIVKTHPPRGPLHQYRVRVATAFRCLRCG